MPLKHPYYDKLAQIESEFQVDRPNGDVNKRRELGAIAENLIKQLQSGEVL